MNTPDVGQKVSVIVDPRTNNGESIAVGFVTKVTSPGDEDNHPRVNVRVLLDTGSDARLTDVVVVDERPENLGSHSGHLAFSS